MCAAGCPGGSWHPLALLLFLLSSFLSQATGPNFHCPFEVMKPRTREPRPAITGLCASPTALWTRLLCEVGFPKNPEADCGPAIRVSADTSGQF